MLSGKKDIWNGALGGAAAGGVLGIRLGRLPLGLGAAAALAATSMLVDTSGQSLRGHGMVNDGERYVERLDPHVGNVGGSCDMCVEDLEGQL